MVRRVTFLILGTLIFALVVSGVAVAGYTPQDIYDDFAADGDLDRNYSDAELNAYLNDAQIHEYGDNSITDRLDDKVLELESK